MADFRFTKEKYNHLCQVRRFKSTIDAVSDEDRSRFGPTTFCPPPSTGLPSPLVSAAAWHKHKGIVEYLVDTFPNALDINANCLVYNRTNEEPCTALVATFSMVDHRFLPDLSFFNYLITKGANINKATPSGVTPLMAAITSRVPRLARLLIENGADISRTDNDGNSCLITAMLSHCYHLCPELVDAGVDTYHCNDIGYTALHIACMDPHSYDIIVRCSLPPLFASSANSAHPNYVPCPLYVATVHQGDLDMVRSFLQRDDCPRECVADAYLLMSVEVLTRDLHTNPLEEIHPFEKARKYIRKGLDYVQQHNIKLCYPPLCPEYSYQEEIKTTEELEAVQRAGLTEVGLITQCALIAERCLGPHTLLYAEVIFKLGEILIRKNLLAEGERIWELSIRTLVSFNDHLSLLQNGNKYFLNKVSCQIGSIAHILDETVRKYSCVPNYPCYIQWGLEVLKMMPPSTLDARQTSSYIMKLFVMWSLRLSNTSTSSFFSHLKSFVEHCQAPALHLALETVKSSLFKNDAEKFVDAVLAVGGDKFIDCADKGQRPLHLVAGNESLTDMLISHGAHVDAVNGKGKTALPRDAFGVPSLYCTTANAIVQYSLPYLSIGLPTHVVQFVVLHDSSCAIE